MNHPDRQEATVPVSTITDAPPAADRLRALADWCEAHNISSDDIAGAGIGYRGSFRVQFAGHDSAVAAYDALCGAASHATCEPYPANEALYPGRMHQQFAADVDGVEVSIVRDVGPAPAEAL